MAWAPPQIDNGARLGRLPGLDTDVGGGSSLSGVGQRRLVALARVLKDPAISFLVEGHSQRRSHSPRTNSGELDMIMAQRDRKPHYLSTVKNADPDCGEARPILSSKGTQQPDATGHYARHGCLLSALSLKTY
ncbi:MAG: hypothetical protein H6661_11465 [Ardenticatenaceae bacterium]|nr:hypothetical protein [Ardenticatenaceae bacterium]